MNAVQISLLGDEQVQQVGDDRQCDPVSLKTVTSLSGGKTSAYMALHYPTDVYLFSAVLTNDPNCVIADRSLRQYCQDKLPWFDWDSGGSREVDLTLSNLRQLEQELGSEIVWVSAPFTFDEVISGKADRALAIVLGGRSTESVMLPNARTRFCTESLKIYPMAWWMYLNGNGMPWITNIGFRVDEPQRVNNWKCDRTDMTLRCDINGRQKGKHRHEMLDYRMVRFPLYEDGVDSLKVRMYWYEKGWKFPTVSNCDFCFHHLPAEMRSQHEQHPDRAQWWIDAEAKANATFGDNKLKDILSSEIDYDALPMFCLCHD